MGGNAAILFVAIGFLLLIGTLLPLLASPLLNASSGNDIVTYSDTAKSFIQNGQKVDLFDFGIIGVFAFIVSPLGLLGGNFQNAIANEINALNLLPSVISIPLIIIISLGLLVGIIKAVIP